MPCEGCHVQFTVFKRKRSCYDCKRYYCHNCLATATTTNNSSSNRSKQQPQYSLCERCLLFNKRPLARADLVKLKPKDLIFYLQSKHISTAGCVEKEELIDLVLQYVDRTDINQQQNSSGGSGNGSSSGGSSTQTTPQHQQQQQQQNDAGDNVGGVDGGGARRSTDYGPNANNSFDSIKQTCQNFFSNLSDNISDSLANLESRACSKTRPERAATASTTGSVTEQPRVATRQIPTYASSQQNSPENPLTSPVRDPDHRSSVSDTSNMETLMVNLPTAPTTPSPGHELHEECNCSDDDEIIATFNGRTRSPKSQIELNLSSNADDEADVAHSCSATTNCAASTTSTSTSKPSSQYSKLEIYINDEEESSHSSFEELGAIGGISDDSKTTTDTTSNTTDHWQMLDLRNPEQDSNNATTATTTTPNVQQDNDKSTTATAETPATSASNTEAILQPHNDKQQPDTNPEPSLPHHQPPPTPTHKHCAPPRHKKVTRRRSESYLNRKRVQTSLDDDEDEASSSAPALRSPLQYSHNRIEEETQTTSTSSAANRKQQQQSLAATASSKRRCCTRCGKNKANIRQQVEKMRRHLESSQMSETDIKQELSEFLAYLEQRTKSVDYSDSEAGISTASVSRHTTEIDEEVEADEISHRHIDTEDERDFTNRTDSYNSYGDHFEGAATNLYDKDSRFINLDDIESIKQLECLTVKQLKEILMLHRVDYKGCCEKQELFDRVERLWKNLKSTPAVEKLPTDELCKICMDAPIECVILECGHMATCTNCGKVLSECPICRQYIVRVVRFFRA